MIARSSDAEVGDEERAMVYDVGEEDGAGAGAGVLRGCGVRVGRGRVVTRRNERTRFYTRDCRARALSANHLPRPCTVRWLPQYPCRRCLVHTVCVWIRDPRVRGGGGKEAPLGRSWHRRFKRLIAGEGFQGNRSLSSKPRREVRRTTQGFLSIV